MAVTWAFRCLLWGFVSGSITTCVANVYLFGDVPIVWKAAAGIFVFWGGLSTLIAFHISTLRCSETHTLKTLLLQYLIFQAGALFAPLNSLKLTRVWKRPRQAQEAFLRKLIARDVKTEYGGRYLRGIETLEDYRQKHPLTKYDHYEDYFKRLADGEKNVCVAGKLDRFGISSGTTGKGKLIPFMASSSMNSALFTTFIRTINASPVQKYAMLYCKPAPNFTKSGLPIAPYLFIPTSNEEGRSPKVLLEACQNVPFSAYRISTDFEATYVHLLFALTDKHLFSFTAPFASQVYRAFTMLEDRSDMLVEDLSLGRVHPSLAIDEDIRRSLDAALRPNPARARELREEMDRGFVGIVGRLWPHLVCIGTIDISGYMKKLNARYTKGIKTFSSAYGCTESMIGANLWLDGRPQQYVVMASEIVVEFIPEQCSEEENPETLFLDEVEIGKRYEIAITTLSGFYRYRMGDVVEIVDFHENCPVVQMKYRTGELLNLRSEKIDKLVVSKAIEECLTGWPEATLVEWSCAESPLLYDDSVAEYDMFYLLFVELKSEADIRLSAEQEALFDESLRKQHEYYDHYRQVGTIRQARVLLVRPGSFRRLREFIITTSTASYNQFKMPKKLRTKATLDLMMGSVLESSSSNA